ncbi:MAG: U32 family peptidase [Clostridia bacterium]|nr:U32 family peptidase [Clostridia bacterium]
MKKDKIEILAPAGSFESVRAAVRSGADAVYLGTKHFNARAKADNFTDEELGEAVDYCHSHGVKVNITMNTLISDSELPDALKVIEHVCKSRADVLILQDLGLASLVKKAAPDIERHASTQMSVQTLSGVKLLEELGYNRVVLPREMTRDEIAAITEGCNAETEIFVHGAHCMSVSGQCYMSAMFGSRSGNRGMCAQPCRLPFSAPGGTGYDLSLKDLSLIDKMKEIRELGVDSLKIEGRLKRPEYVGAAVSCVRGARDGDENPELKENLRAVFSRSGFTAGYFENNRGRDMFGIRKKEDVTAASSDVLKKLALLYDKEQPLIPVDFCLTVAENERVSLSASALGFNCFISEDYIPEKAINKPMTKESLAERLSKCGGTQFYADKIEIDLDEGLIAPASVINSLRRRALSELENKLASVKQKSFTSINIKKPQDERNSPLKYNIIVSDLSQIPDNLENVENLYLPLSIEENSVEKLKNLPVSLGIQLPRGIFGMEKAVEKKLSALKKCGITVAYCSTLDAVAIARRLGFEIHGGFSLNVFNSVSAEVLEGLGVKSLTLSPELTLNQIADLHTKVKKGIIGYGRLPLMLTRNCPSRNGRSCQECKGRGYLTDRLDKKFPILCLWGCSEILNSQPIYLGDRLSEIKNCDFITFFFTKEKKELCEAILDAYRKGRGVKGDFTRGLYYRGVL